MKKLKELSTDNYIPFILPNKVITNNVDTDLIEIALPAGSKVGGFLSATVTADNGVDYQAHTDIFVFSAVNKGGVYTTHLTNAGTNDSVVTSSGTLAVSWTITTGVDKIIIRVNGNSSLSSPTMTANFILHNHTGQTITLL